MPFKRYFWPIATSLLEAPRPVAPPLVDLKDEAPTRPAPLAGGDTTSDTLAIEEHDATTSHPQTSVPVTVTHPKHRPRHDAESIFWIIVWGLSRIFPKPTQNPETSGFYHQFCTIMLNHQVGLCYEVLGRGVYRGLQEELWREIVHPDLNHLASMVAKMGQYLSIRWDKHEPQPDSSVDTRRVHAFQGMKALLLQEIRRMHGYSILIPFDPTPPRPAKMVSAGTNFRQTRTKAITRCVGKQNPTSDRVTRGSKRKAMGEGAAEEIRGSKKPKQSHESEVEVQPIASGSGSGPLNAHVELELGDMDREERGELQERVDRAMEEASQHQTSKLQRLYTAKEQEVFVECQSWSREFQQRHFEGETWFAPG